MAAEARMETPLSLDPPQPWPGPKPPEGRPHVWQGKEFGFGDVIDIVNPLQHIPVVNTLYRAITGDEIGNVPRVLGDTLFGGPLGFITGMINVALREDSGKDLGEHVLALVMPDGGDDPAGSTVVAAKPAADDGGVPATAGKDAPEDAPEAASADAAAGVEMAAVGQAMPATVAGGTTRPVSPFQVAARTGGGKQAFLAQSAASQRHLLGPAATGAGGGVAAATARPFNSTPVPLQLPAIPGFAQGRPTRPGMAAASATAAAMPAPAVPSALPSPTAANATAPAGTLPSNPPVEISQRMFDALDKYARMQQERSARPAGRGGRVDVSQ
jgi:hypothetical protein